MPAPATPSKEIVDNLFSDTPPEAPKDDKAPVDPPVIIEDEVDDDVPPVDAPDDDEEEDYDEIHTPKPVAEEDDIPDESAARVQAKLRGKEAKELKAKLTEAELELDRVRKDASDTKERLDELTATQLRPEDHEDYKALRDGVMSDVRSASRRLVGEAKTLFPSSFGKLMARYLEASDAAPENVVDEDEKLAGNIVTSLKLSEIPYEDLDADERAALQPTVDKVLDVLERNAGKTKDLRTLHTSLSEKSKVGQLSVGVRAYENSVKDFKPILDSVGDLAEDLIESNPHAIGSVVAKLIKSSPEAAKRAEKARADVLEVLIGPRALTQAEIDKMEAKGESVKEFLTERAKVHQQKRLKYAAMFTEGLMTRSLLKEALVKLAKYESVKESEESEFDVIHRIGKKKAALPVEVKKVGTAVDRLFSGE